MHKIIFGRKITLFLLILLIIMPPFFSGGRDFFIVNGWLIIVGLILILFFLLGGQNVSFKKPHFWWIVFLGLSLLSVLQSISIYHSIGAFGQLLACAILFFVASQLKLSSRERRLLLLVLMGIGFIMALIGLYLYLTGHYYLVTSTFYWSNPFAGYLLMILPLAFFYFLELKRPYAVLGATIFVILLSAFILTQSRGAWISLCLAGLICLPIYYKKITRGDVGKIGLIFLLVIVLAGTLLFLKLNLSTEHNWSDFLKNDNGASSVTRLNYWTSSIKMFFSRPIFGFGPNTFVFIYPAYQQNVLSSTRYAHNYFLEMLAEQGIFVALSFIALLLVIFYRSYRALGRTKNGLILAIFIGLIAATLHNFIDFDWAYPANLITFWLLAGLVCGFFQPEAGLKIDGHKKIALIAPISLALPLILFGAVNLYTSYQFNQALADKSIVRSEQKIRSVLLLNPHPDYYSYLSQILFTRWLNAPQDIKLLDDAEKNIETAIRINPYQPPYYQIMARIEYSLNKKDLANQLLEKTLRIDSLNRPSIHIDLINLYLAKNQLDLAQKTANNILANYSDDVLRLQEFAIIPGQASMTQLKPQISLIYYLRGVAEERSDNLAAAREDWMKSLELDPNNQDAKISLNNSADQ